MQETQEMQFWSLGWKDPLEKEMQPTPVLLPEKPHEQRSLAFSSPKGFCKELDTVEQLSTCRPWNILKAWPRLSFYPWSGTALCFVCIFLLWSHTDSIRSFDPYLCFGNVKVGCKQITEQASIFRKWVNMLLSIWMTLALYYLATKHSHCSETTYTRAGETVKKNVMGEQRCWGTTWAAQCVVWSGQQGWFLGERTVKPRPEV